MTKTNLTPQKPDEATLTNTTIISGYEYHHVLELARMTLDLAKKEGEELEAHIAFIKDQLNTFAYYQNTPKAIDQLEAVSYMDEDIVASLVTVSVKHDFY